MARFSLGMLFTLGGLFVCYSATVFGPEFVQIARLMLYTGAACTVLGQIFLALAFSREN